MSFSFTAQNIIDLAALDIGVLASGETLQPEEYVDCLNKLNGMMQAWDTMRLNIFAASEAVYTLTSGQYLYTIGTEGSPSFNALRPVSIRAANIISGGLRFGIRIISVEDWAMLPEQSNVATVPRLLYYDNDYPQARIYLNPGPNSSSTQLELFTWEQLTQFASLTTPFDLPPAYQNAIEWNLAVDLCDMFGRPITQTVAGNAQRYMQALQGLNLPPSPGQSQEAQARMKAMQGVTQGAVPEAVQQQ
jgi:hypothetical protein